MRIVLLILTCCSLVYAETISLKAAQDIAKALWPVLLNQVTSAMHGSQNLEGWFQELKT